MFRGSMAEVVLRFEGGDHGLVAAASGGFHSTDARQWIEELA